MEIVTPFGVKWRIAPYSEVFIYIFLFILLLLFFMLLKYLQNVKEKKINDYQLFLFKMKRLGLSNFQIKIINNIVEILRLSNSAVLLENPEFFEKGVGNFLLFLRDKNEKEESLSSICKDITITYEKLYHPSTFKKPLKSLMEIENNQLLYFTTYDRNVYLGKIIDKNPNEIFLQLFLSPKNLKKLSVRQKVDVHIWRIGDAEYVFKTTTNELTGNILRISTVEEFVRIHEFRHPYLDVIIQASLTRLKTSSVDEEEIVDGTIHKMNEYEAVVRVSNKLNFQREYILDFEINEFKFSVPIVIIANKTIEGKNILYYTIKFGEMPESAMNVLKKYIYEHL